MARVPAIHGEHRPHTDGYPNCTERIVNAPSIHHTVIGRVVVGRPPTKWEKSTRFSDRCQALWQSSGPSVFGSAHAVFLQVTSAV